MNMFVQPLQFWPFRRALTFCKGAVPGVGKGALRRLLAPVNNFIFLVGNKQDGHAILRRGLALLEMLIILSISWCESYHIAFALAFHVSTFRNVKDGAQGRCLKKLYLLPLSIPLPPFSSLQPT